MLRRFKKKVNPDLVISTLDICTSLSVLSGGKDKKIGIFHSPLCQAKILGRYVYLVNLLSYKFLYSKLDKIFCVSEEVKADVIDNIPQIDKNKVDVVYNIHDFDHILSFASLPLDDKYIRIFDSDVILYVGNLYDIKAPDRLIHAFAYFKKNYSKPVNLVFVGSDQFGTLKKLKELVSYYKLDDLVFFLGNQPNPYNFINRSKCLVSSSISEGLPGVIIESLIINTPVIATNSSRGVWEIFSCNENYNPNIQDLFITSKGIICPNTYLCRENYFQFNDDDIYLAEAMSKLFIDQSLYAAFNLSKFKFKDSVRSNSVVEYYLSLF